MLFRSLVHLLRAVNRGRTSRKKSAGVHAAEWLIELLFRPSIRLAIYGSLAPGRENHHVLADLDGEWLDGHVRGRYEARGWGSALGYPALRWDPKAESVAVWVLFAEQLKERWSELDRFEGPDYVRCLVPVFSGSRPICIANIYLAR